MGGEGKAAENTQEAMEEASRSRRFLSPDPQPCKGSSFSDGAYLQAPGQGTPGCGGNPAAIRRDTIHSKQLADE